MQDYTPEQTQALAEKAKGILQQHYRVTFYSAAQYAEMSPHDLSQQIEFLNGVKGQINEDCIRTSERLKSQEAQLADLKSKALEKYGVDTSEGLQDMADNISKEIEALLSAHVSPEAAAHVTNAHPFQ